jgi:ketosteroid isomerase-like protein
MSRKNVELVRRGYEHFQATGDFLDELLAPDFVWDMSTFRGWPEQQLYYGVAGARHFIADWTAAFEEWEISAHELRDGGADKVVAILRQRARSRTTGVPVDMLLAQVFTVRDGRQTRMEMYADPAEALKAVGLEA